MKEATVLLLDSAAVTCEAWLAYQELKQVLSDVMSSGAGPALQQGKEAARAGREIVSPKLLNRAIKDRLMALGWRSEVTVQGKMSLDFMKHGVAVEVQFGKYPYAAENIHVKMPLAVSCAGLGVCLCVIVVPTADMARRMSTSIATFEATLRNYVDPPCIRRRIDYPLVLLGLDISLAPPADSATVPQP